jgi:GNAT superfamily N-acetyltransferase
MEQEWRKGEYVISTVKSRLNLDVIHEFLNHSYWAAGRSPERIRRSIENSLAFGIYRGSEQIGFARIITDFATFAWIADVFVLEAHRGKGLGKWLMEILVSQPELQGLRRWVLSTRDAHGLYRQFGFTELKRPERWMERADPSMEEKPDYWAQ